MSAFYDLKQRGDAKYKKYRRDILKLALLLIGNEEIILVGRMKKDFDTFLAHLEQDVDSNKKIASPGADRGTRTPTDCSIHTSRRRFSPLNRCFDNYCAICVQ